jgi:hypothetical protein
MMTKLSFINANELQNYKIFSDIAVQLLKEFHEITKMYFFRQGWRFKSRKR